MAAKQSAAATKRVATLLNAISDLHEGDLLAVLKLVTPLHEYDEYDWIDLGAEGNLVCISLRGRLRRGESLGRLLEQHLESVLVFGECHLRSLQKRKRSKKEIGGRRWSTRDNRGRESNHD